LVRRERRSKAGQTQAFGAVRDRNLRGVGWKEGKKRWNIFEEKTNARKDSVEKSKQEREESNGGAGSYMNGRGPYSTASSKEGRSTL